MFASHLNELSERALSDVPSRLGSARRWGWLAAFAAPAAVALIWPHLHTDGTHTFLNTIVGCVLALLLAACAYTDFSSRKIPNWATYPALLWALLLNAAHDLKLLQWLATPEHVGAIGFEQSLLGTGACFVTMFLIYSISGGGAGDVKLAAAIGAFLGAERGLMALGFTYLIAGLVTVGWTTWRIGPIKLGTTLLRRIGKIIVPARVTDPTTEEQTLLTSPVPLAGFFAFGTLLVLCEADLAASPLSL